MTNDIRPIFAHLHAEGRAVKADVMYRIGPAESPSDYLDLAEPDMTAAFVVARRRWPNEPLFCREQCANARTQAESPARPQAAVLVSVN
jgi:hypothetical protein